jgi:hypothetical protein
MLLTQSVLMVKFALTRIRCMEFPPNSNLSPEFGPDSVPMHKLHPSLSVCNPAVGCSSIKARADGLLFHNPVMEELLTMQELSHSVNSNARFGIRNDYDRFSPW